MGILKKALVFLGILVVILIVVGFLLPQKVHVERSVTIAEGFSDLGATLTEGERREERRHKSASFVERHFYIEGLWASENA